MKTFSQTTGGMFKNRQTTAVQEQNGVIQIESITPNPTSGQFLLTIQAKGSHVSELVVLDLKGKEVLHENWQLVDGKNSHSVSLKNVETGAYFVVVSGDTFRLSQKITVSK
jgi:hypothetical protein